MANHDYRDERFGRTRDLDRGRDREGDREWLGGRERGWDPAREGWGGEPPQRERERGSDFSRGRGEWSDENRGRGLFDRARDTSRSWMSDDDDDDARRGRARERRPTESFGYNDLAGTTGGFGNQTFGSTPHDHYLDWRERQIAELDRDYRDYCQEREQSFHQDFESWRRSRGNAQPQARQGDGMRASRGSGTAGTSAPQEPLELTEESSAAILGTAETPNDGRSG